MLDILPMLGCPPCSFFCTAIVIKTLLFYKNYSDEAFVSHVEGQLFKT